MCQCVQQDLPSFFLPLSVKPNEAKAHYCPPYRSQIEVLAQSDKLVACARETAFRLIKKFPHVLISQDVIMARDVVTPLNALQPWA